MARMGKLDAMTRVVAIGGGRGLGRVVSALSALQSRLSAIVATTDNGGSTGKLRAADACIAWGDLRNCLSQLSEHPSINTILFEYRFTIANELHGHSLGNLMLYALDQLSVRPLETVRIISKMLDVTVELLPMAEQACHLTAIDSQGRRAFGEVAVDEMTSLPKQLALTPPTNATPEVVTRLQQAELILLGPGSFFTSLVPPLLLTEVANTIALSPATLVFIDNLQPEHTQVDKLSTAQKVDFIEHLLNGRPIDKILCHGTQIMASQPEFCQPKPWQPKLCQHEHSRYYYRPLVQSTTDGLHDRKLLLQALESLLE